MKYSEHFNNYVKDLQHFKRLTVEGKSDTKQGDQLMNDIEFSWFAMTEEERDVIRTGPNIDPYLPYRLFEE